MGRIVFRKLQLNELFNGFTFAHSSGGYYRAEQGWYPLLGLPGSFDIQRSAVLFCRLKKSIEAEIRDCCLNGVIERIRVHRSARVKGPDSMLVLASDLVSEFEICQVPLMTEPELREFIDAVDVGSGTEVAAA